MSRKMWLRSATLALCALSAHAVAATCERTDDGLLVAGKGYRVGFGITSADFTFELPDGQGGWRSVSDRLKPQFAFAERAQV